MLLNLTFVAEMNMKKRMEEVCSTLLGLAYKKIFVAIRKKAKPDVLHWYGLFLKYW